MKASQIVEGVLFASDAPLKAEEIARADESLDEDRVQEAIEDLRTLYDESERAFQIVELGEGYQILTRPEFAPYLERFDTVPRPSRLSGPALETLAIIAYRQPIGRIEIEYIRGVQVGWGDPHPPGPGPHRRGGPSRGAGPPPPLRNDPSGFSSTSASPPWTTFPGPRSFPILLRERAPSGGTHGGRKRRPHAMPTPRPRPSPRPRHPERGPEPARKNRTLRLPGIRIQKYLSRAGVASRREAEKPHPPGAGQGERRDRSDPGNQGPAGRGPGGTRRAGRGGDRHPLDPLPQTPGGGHDPVRSPGAAHGVRAPARATCRTSGTWDGWISPRRDSFS